MLEGRFPRVRSALAAGLVARDPGFVDARRRLATVLVADAVGYTARMETNARAALTALFECRNLIAEAVEGAGGTVVDTPGDFFLSLMPTVPVAVACAVAIQRELGERNRNCEEDYRAVYETGVVTNAACVRSFEEQSAGADGFRIFGHERTLLRRRNDRLQQKGARSHADQSMSHQNWRLLSTSTVTGPSLTNSTCIIAWNSPVATTRPDECNSLTTLS